MPQPVVAMGKRKNAPQKRRNSDDGAEADGAQQKRRKTANNQNDSKKHLKVARELASNEKRTRTKAIKNTVRWLTSRGDALTELEVMQLWKGLFYSLFMADGRKVQEELAERLAHITLQFPDTKHGLLYQTCLWKTFKREWPGIDRLRLDKCYSTLSYGLTALFTLAKRNKWAGLEDAVALLHEHVVECEPTQGDGVALHVCDVYWKQLDKALDASQPLNDAQIQTILKPMYKALQSSPRATLVDRAAETVLALGRLAAAAVEHQNSEDEEQEDLECPQLSALLREEVLQTVSKTLFDMAAGQMLESNRGKVYALRRQFIRVTGIADLVVTGDAAAEPAASSQTKSSKKNKTKGRKDAHKADGASQQDNDTAMDTAADVKVAESEGQGAYQGKGTDAASEPSAEVSFQLSKDGLNELARQQEGGEERDDDDDDDAEAAQRSNGDVADETDEADAPGDDIATDEADLDGSFMASLTPSKKKTPGRRKKKKASNAATPAPKDATAWDVLESVSKDTTQQLRNQKQKATTQQSNHVKEQQASTPVASSKVKSNGKSGASTKRTRKATLQADDVKAQSTPSKAQDAASSQADADGSNKTPQSILRTKTSRRSTPGSTLTWGNEAMELSFDKKRPPSELQKRERTRVPMKEPEVFSPPVTRSARKKKAGQGSSPKSTRRSGRKKAGGRN